MLRQCRVVIILPRYRVIGSEPPYILASLQVLFMLSVAHSKDKSNVSHSIHDNEKSDAGKKHQYWRRPYITRLPEGAGRSLPPFPQLLLRLRFLTDIYLIHVKRAVERQQYDILCDLGSCVLGLFEYNRFDGVISIS